MHHVLNKLCSLNHLTPLACVAVLHGCVGALCMMFSWLFNHCPTSGEALSLLSYPKHRSGSMSYTLFIYCGDVAAVLEEIT